MKDRHRLENRVDVATSEDEDDTTDRDDGDKIYYTDPEKPFIINQLGGYNPEEDFKAVSQDLDDPKAIQELDKDENSQIKRSEPIRKDIVFSESDANGFSDDATGTDDAAFEADDPYTNDKIELGKGSSGNEEETSEPSPALDEESS